MLVYHSCCVRHMLVILINVIGLLALDLKPPERGVIGPRNSMDSMPQKEVALNPFKHAWAETAQVQRANQLKQMVWLHVPKCGSAFLNTLYHNPTLCPYVPDNAWLADKSTGQLVDFYRDYPPDTYCPGSWSAVVPPNDYHPVLGRRYRETAGHIVTMLRQPEQRIMSSFYFVRDELKRKVAEPLPNYARSVQGCYVMMIVGDDPELGYHCLGMDLISIPTPTEEQDALAVQRLREGVAFVGLTDDWDLSICLFHAMFGGTCVPEEMEYNREGPNRTGHEPYDTAAMEDFVDVHDGKVYAEGVRMFESNLKEYQVTRPSCRASCSFTHTKSLHAH